MEILNFPPRFTREELIICAYVALFSVGGTLFGWESFCYFLATQVQRLLVATEVQIIPFDPGAAGF